MKWTHQTRYKYEYQQFKLFANGINMDILCHALSTAYNYTKKATGKNHQTDRGVKRENYMYCIRLLGFLPLYTWAYLCLFSVGSYVRVI